MWLNPFVIEDAKRLLRLGGLSQREIARRLGISRASVANIAHGLRPAAEPRERTDDSWLPPGRPARCPRCGARVYMPCRACRVRAIRERQRRTMLDSAAWRPLDRKNRTPGRPAA